MAAARAEA